jgi:O-antigen biosynthesis protein WbqP
MKRLFDFMIGSLLLFIFFIPMILIGLIVRLTSEGPALYWSDRIGQYNKIIKMPKFRSMLSSTPPVATHLIKNSENFLTPIGGFLRRFSLDELPQLLSILKGDMSFVGPRPALFNQDDLISLRKKKGIDALVPGLTGWAQINGRDNISINEKVDLDFEYLQKQSFLFDLKIIKLTFFIVIKKANVSH